jgi:hypothetical protein
MKDLFRSASRAPPGDEEGSGTTSTESGYPPLPPQAEMAVSGPPNLQLNLSSDHFDQNTLKKRHELILAAVAAVLLQTGLIVIAATIAYRLNTGSSSLFETKVYGFPCYAAGSLLLPIGTGLCSFIVEHSTIEHSWEAVNLARAKPDGKKAKPQQNAPRQVWIQRYQTVNGQSFKGYIILAGPKRRVITSRRDDDIGKHHLSDDSAPQSSHLSSGGKNEVYLLSSYHFEIGRMLCLTLSGVLAVAYCWRCSFGRPWVYSSVHGPPWPCIPLLYCSARRYLHHGAHSS